MIKLLLKKGMKISTTDVHGISCEGHVLYFLENTVIIENITERYVISNGTLLEQGYSFSENLFMS
ncbi:hypothetical protein A5816_002961 [Enterococcus sp. 3G1_DIV0629]|nr:hypothetical protein A5816_002961 [Enterococcus sp. 3G1_DIV0629]